MKRYILFDNDGVLVETEVWYFRANVRVLGEMGITLHEELYLKLMAQGRTSWELAREAGFGEEAITNARHRRNAYYQHYLKTEEIAIKGVEEVIRALSKHYRMGIVTTSRRADFEIIHAKRGITEHMEFVLCEEDYPRAKPHPDPYLKGLGRFGASKAQAIVVEDSQRGLTSAVRAGIDCVIVKNDFTRTHDFSQATHRIDSLSELEALLA
jgi:HAD superfamily hydrolase (TIGR01509 family)